MDSGLCDVVIPSLAFTDSRPLSYKRRLSGSSHAGHRPLADLAAPATWLERGTLEVGRRPGTGMAPASQAPTVRSSRDREQGCRSLSFLPAPPFRTLAKGLERTKTRSRKRSPAK